MEKLRLSDSIQHQISIQTPTIIISKPTFSLSPPPLFLTIYTCPPLQPMHLQPFQNADGSEKRNPESELQPTRHEQPDAAAIPHVLHGCEAPNEIPPGGKGMPVEQKADPQPLPLRSGEASPPHQGECVQNPEPALHQAAFQPDPGSLYHSEALEDCIEFINSSHRKSLFPFRDVACVGPHRSA